MEVIVSSGHHWCSQEKDCNTVIEKLKKTPGWVVNTLQISICDT